jgi:hypothetical protein
MGCWAAKEKLIKKSVEIIRAKRFIIIKNYKEVV